MRFMLLAVLAVMLSLGPVADAAEAPELKPSPARRWANAASAMMLGAARTGERIVAIGEHGIVMLSDDGGTTFRQAQSVPVSTTLTAVAFADDRRGWAVGHWGAIIATEDGGETWRLQRSDATVDQPLFSVTFTSPAEGWAVGLWSLFLHTTDGGATWVPVTLPPPPGSGKADRNLTQVFSDGKGALYVTAELGSVLRSGDGGKTWSYGDTGYRGTLWTGMVASTGTIVVGGLNGRLFRSADNGTTWSRIPSEVAESITALIEINGVVVGSALSGAMVHGLPEAPRFATQIQPEKRDITGLVRAAPGRLLLTTVQGTVLIDAPKP
ncbi:conserved exported hypothetical protein [Candidatus Terasakiella magnetica]|nr:conserved exported hypothetical protein [Candidatus Terasakiella magnetica]